MIDWITIRIPREVRERIAKHGKFDESIYDVINRMADVFEKYKEKEKQ